MLPSPFKYSHPKKLLDLKPPLNTDEVNYQITHLIRGNRPFVVGRLGSVELEVIRRYKLFYGSYANTYLYKLLDRAPWSMRNRMQFKDNAGFFPVTDSNLTKFSKLMIELCPHVDILGSWIPGENSLENEFKNTAVCNLRDLEPYYHTSPWSHALEGKTVLVIHPFSDSICEQFHERRTKIFDNPNILPEFQLKTLKAVQSAASSETNFENWFEALDFMYKKVLETNFDIAIIGCGAYGLPLSIKLKVAGKKVIHLGGATQILFGLMGKRWDTHPFISKLYNENWRRPSNKERPINANRIEGGCYW